MKKHKYTAQDVGYLAKSTGRTWVKWCVYGPTNAVICEASSQSMARRIAAALNKERDKE